MMGWRKGHQSRVTARGQPPRSRCKALRPERGSRVEEQNHPWPFFLGSSSLIRLRMVGSFTGQGGGDV